MPTFSSHAIGTPCWVDLMSPDPDASKAYYTAVFSWTAEDQFDDDGNNIYTLFTKDGMNVAGLGGPPPGAPEQVPAVWSTYVAVDDPTAIEAKVAEAGGSTMMPPMEVMTSGSMAIFVDPTGAVFSVWKAGDHIGADVCNEPDTWSWNELMTRDIDTALAFYSSVFGWSYDPQDMGPMGTYHVIAGGENEGLGGLMAMPAEAPEQVPAHWAVYFWVADIEKSIAAVNDHGGQVVNGPMAIPGVGTTATIHDPVGAVYNLLQPESD